MRPFRIALVVPFALAASACTWVHMAPGADKVRVVAVEPAGCEKRGEIEVSVKDNVLYYKRNELKVRDELETLARNEAPGLGADSISPLTQPTAGNQRWAMWRCNG